MWTGFSYLQSILWVHEKVPPDVVEHDGVLSVVKLAVLSPDHSERLHLRIDTIHSNLFSGFIPGTAGVNLAPPTPLKKKKNNPKTHSAIKPNPTQKYDL